MKFDEASAVLKRYKFMTPDQGRIVYEHIRRTQPRRVLELGTAFGTSAGYMAAALAANGGGTLTTVDRYHFTDPVSPEQVLNELGVMDRVDVVRIEHSSYCWWLMEEIEARTSGDAVQPTYDFCYLDGAHNFAIDGLAVVLVQQLLTPGSWLLLDDLEWTYGKEGRRWATPDMSAAELARPHVGAVLEHVIKPHPAFNEVRVQGGYWAWARVGGETGSRTPVQRGMPGFWPRLATRVRTRLRR